MTNFQMFQYKGIQIKEALHIKGTPYFTRKAIGEWLGYKNPQSAINIIIRRNPHIENKKFSTSFKLKLVEGNKTVTRTIKVYNPIGLQLIVFESRKPKAIQYKIAVAKLVHDIMTREYDWHWIKNYLGWDNEKGKQQ